MSSVRAVQQPAGHPPFLLDLVQRAASLLRAHAFRGPVPFVWWADGEDCAYLATIEWPSMSADPAPRVVVLAGRSGDFVCRSMPGDWFAIDPTAWVLDVAPDEADRELSRQRSKSCAQPHWGG